MDAKIDSKADSKSGLRGDSKNSSSYVKRQLYNLECEQVLLGSIILNNEYLYRIMDIVVPEHFYDPSHKKIFSQIIHMVIARNLIADVVTLADFFENDEVLLAMGGKKYLKTLISSVNSVINVVDYAKIVYEFFLKRNLALIAEEIINNIESSNETSSEKQIEMAEAELYNLYNSRNQTKNDFREFKFSIMDALENTKKAIKNKDIISGVTTGFKSLDQMMGGMQRSDLIILAGRPSMGKTALAMNIAFNSAREMYKEFLVSGDKKSLKSVGFFSLEMSSIQLTSRILSMETDVNSVAFRTGRIKEEGGVSDDGTPRQEGFRKITDTEMQRISQIAGEISNYPLFIDDTPAISISGIRNKVRKMVIKNRLALLVIDYLQLIRLDKRIESRVQEVSEITQSLKAIAKEFNIPVLVLSQLSRDVEKRDDRIPQLSDLRESGSIEQDADVVAFIYRESYYHERKKPSDEAGIEFEDWKVKMYGNGVTSTGKIVREGEGLVNSAKVIIAKQRNGPIGDVALRFFPDRTKFGDPTDKSFAEF